MTTVAHVAGRQIELPRAQRLEMLSVVMVRRVRACDEQNSEKNERGARLGRNGADRLAPAYRAEAVQRARQHAPVLTEMKSARLSARQMAAELTLRGIQTPTGARWAPPNGASDD